MSDATESQTQNVTELCNDDSLTDDEREAAESLLQLLANAPEIGSLQLKQMRPLLSKIDREKRAPYGLGWEV